MSFIKDLETFASKMEKEIEKLWGAAPKFETVALTTLTFVGPVLETVISLEGGPIAGNAATAIINKAETDLTAASSLVTAIGPTLSVKNLILGVQTSLSSLLTASQVKNPTSVADVTLIVKELAALVAAFPPTPAVAIPAAALSPANSVAKEV
jgi:hypothetical protein